MKVLHIIDTLHVGGAEMLLKKVIEGLKDEEQIVCYLNEPSTYKEEMSKYAEVICLDHRSNFDFLKSIIKLRNILHLKKVDIVHSHLIKSSWIAKLACGNRIPLVYSIHNNLSKDAFEINGLSLIMERLTYNRKHTLISVSKASLIDYTKNVNTKGKKIVLYNFVGNEFFEANYLPKVSVTQGYKLIAVGNLRRQKNYDKLILAFEPLKHLPISLDIYGDGTLKARLQEIINKTGVNVRLMGNINDVHKKMVDYDTYIMASLFEGFGIAPMEAMAVGMPVILSEIDVFREVAEDKPHYFNPDNAKNISVAILWAYNNWSDFLKQSNENKAFIKTKASQSEYLKNLKNIYTSSMKKADFKSLLP